MEYRVVCANSTIGTSLLEGSDPSMGMAFGAFVPTSNYESVRHVFDLFRDATDRKSDSEASALRAAYYRERDALDLRLETQDSRVISTNWIHIVEYDPSYYELEVQIPDPSFFES